MAELTDEKDFDAKAIVDHVTYFRLAQSAQYVDPRSDVEWWSVLTELEGTSIDRLIGRLEEEQFNRFLVVPAAYDAEDRKQVVPYQPVVLFATSDLVTYLNDRRNDLGIASLRVGGVVDQAFLDPRVRPGKPLPDIKVPAGTVVQAFVDDGMGIAHDLFRKGPKASRVDFAQIFDTVPLPSSPTSIGRVLERVDIDALLDACTYNEVLDEELFYTRSGQVDLAQDIFSTVAIQRSHGTHVMGLGAGHGGRGGRPPEHLCRPALAGGQGHVGRGPSAAGLSVVPHPGETGAPLSHALWRAGPGGVQLFLRQPRGAA